MRLLTRRKRQRADSHLLQPNTNERAEEEREEGGRLNPTRRF